MSTGRAGGREGGSGAGQLRRRARQVLPSLPCRAPRRLRPHSASRSSRAVRSARAVAVRGRSRARRSAFGVGLPAPARAPATSPPPTALQHLMSGSLYSRCLGKCERAVSNFAAASVPSSKLRCCEGPPSSPRLPRARGRSRRRAGPHLVPLGAAAGRSGGI